MSDKTSAEYLGEAIHDTQVAATLADEGQTGSWKRRESEWRQRQAIAKAIISVSMRLDELARIVERKYRGIDPD